MEKKYDTEISAAHARKSVCVCGGRIVSLTLTKAYALPLTAVVEVAKRNVDFGTAYLGLTAIRL